MLIIVQQPQIPRPNLQLLLARGIELVIDAGKEGHMVKDCPVAAAPVSFV